MKREDEKPEQFLSVSDISKLLGCSKTKAYEIVRQEDFPKITIGRGYYIPVSAFNNWVRKYVGKEYMLV